ERVRVAAWWRLDAATWICKSSYSPLVSNTHYGREPGDEVIPFQYCEADRLWPSPCRCGPYLSYCAPDERTARALPAAYRDEVVRTIQRVILSHRPFPEMLLTRKTVRSGYAEFYYARNRYFRTGRFELESPLSATTATARDRDPEFDAGVLVTPWFRYY